MTQADTLRWFCLSTTVESVQLGHTIKLKVHATFEYLEFPRTPTVLLKARKKLRIKTMMSDRGKSDRE